MSKNDAVVNRLRKYNKDDSKNRKNEKGFKKIGLKANTLWKNHRQTQKYQRNRQLEKPRLNIMISVTA